MKEKILADRYRLTEQIGMGGMAVAVGVAGEGGVVATDTVRLVELDEIGGVGGLVDRAAEADIDEGA